MKVLIKQAEQMFFMEASLFLVTWHIFIHVLNQLVPSFCYYHYHTVSYDILNAIKSLNL